MDYEYDIFISYRNEADSADWVQNILYDRLEFLLKQALNKGEVRIFMDKEEIRSGDDWANRIKRALITSRCMIPVLIPDYFHREWCLNEFAFMLNRERKLGYRTTKNPTGLILPIRLFDGHLFPEYANAIQGRQFQKYFKPSELFTTLPLYSDFDDEMKEWIWEIAKAINNAPKFDADWFKPEWFETPDTTPPPQNHAPKL